MKKAIRPPPKLRWKLPATATLVTVPIDRLYAVTNVAHGKASTQSSTANGDAGRRWQYQRRVEWQLSDAHQ